jgi:hypothetical protein
VSNYRTLAVFCLLSLAACNKLPKETTSGKNTFGCRVDGKIWNTYTEHWLDRAVEPEYEDGFFTVKAERDTRDRGGTFFLQLSDSLGIRTRTYTAATDRFYATYSPWEDNGDLYLTDTTDATSILTIKHFTPPPAQGEYAIISGTFSFNLTSPNTGKKYVITDGRFDIKAK